MLEGKSYNDPPAQQYLKEWDLMEAKLRLLYRHRQLKIVRPTVYFNENSIDFVQVGPGEYDERLVNMRVSPAQSESHQEIMVVENEDQSVIGEMKMGVETT